MAYLCLRGMLRSDAGSFFFISNGLLGVVVISLEVRRKR